ncbi:tRNA glutamyl-Q(34) synthetase GluQRS [Phreatobacter sp.]|uniref:tRNA glutamyl-Q(34) synthetase GluQRS n=1 Tax=Phreatobacter sp. TaxID=1966341 RepID=UPI0025DEC671|nr:tRNA glutamyl-Q(34) synthetase GluQRS [Phreatobacter sp.]
MTVAHPPPARQPVLRFAPSPNGLLHLGHARSALENERMAAALGGRLLLRVEDIDRARCRPEHEAAMIADLAWLGLAFETPYRRQSDHLADHRALLARLAAMGLVYPAFESRGDVKALAAAAAAATGKPVATDPDGAPLYAGRGREMPAEEAAARIAAGEPHALRLAMDAALARLDRPLTWTEVDVAGLPLRTVTAHPQRWGDVVLARKDLGTSYHLAVVADDALQGVTHVVRGADLFEATAVHRLLQELLGLPAPLYRHHPLVLGADGKKLSKSDQAEGFRALRAAGISAEEVRARLGF